MANYSLVINSKFQPFSFERYIQPYQMYGEAYKEVENALGELATKASVWEEMANEQTDPYAYKMYKSYADDLNAQADLLAKEGLNATSRRGMLNMRARYSKEITPIEQAYTLRQKQAEEQQKALLQDPTLMLSRRASTTSLDDYIRNPQLAYEAYSGKLLTAQASQAAGALSKEMRSNPRKWRNILGDSYYETMMQKGFSSDAVLQAVQGNPEAARELTSIVEDAISSSGVRNWGDQATLDRAYDYARQGLWSAVGETQYQTLDNWRARLQAQQDKELEVARIKAGLSGKDGNKNKTTNIDRTSYYFPKDRLEIPNVVDNEGKLKNSLKVKKTTGSGYYTINDLFTNGKFSRPNMRGEKPQVIQGVTAYYDRINNILLNSGFSQEAINNMSKENIEGNIRAITEANAADVLGRNIYRFALDDSATEHIIGKIKGRGLKVQELEGLGKEGPRYSDQTELEYEKGQIGDILFDAKTKDFLMLHNGHYYRLPKGMISNDFYNEIEGYLAEDKGGMSLFRRNQAIIEALAGKTNLTEREKNLLLQAREGVYNIDTRLGALGEEFVKYIGTKNTTN